MKTNNPDDALNTSVLADFAALDKLPERIRSFYIEGLYCASCVHSIEGILHTVPGIGSLRLNFPNATLEVELSSGGSFVAVAKELERLGYSARPLLDDPEKLYRKENRIDLLRIGVAGACSGNIMLLTVSLYGGAASQTALSFAWLSLILSLPVLLFSAVPFFKNSWSAIKQKKISIDFPIVMALVAGYSASMLQLLQGKPDIYFDSLTMLVFLLLSSRYFLKRMQQRQLSSAGLLHFFKNPLATLIDDSGNATEVPIAALQIGQKIRVGTNSQFPADAILRDSTANIDAALLTGESEPLQASFGESVYAGTINLGKPVLVEIEKLPKHSRLGKIFSQIESAANARTPLALFSDAIGRYFSVATLAVACGILLFFHDQPSEGVRRALALIIVSCPCVLALAIPFVSSLAISLAAKRGSLIKNPDVLEKFGKVKKVFLDKTGTLTNGRYTLERFDFSNNNGDYCKTVAYKLEENSRHPLARAITRSLSAYKGSTIEVQNWQEKIGQGVSGDIEGSHWEIRRHNLPQNQQSILELSRDGNIQALIFLSDSLRKDSLGCIQQLKKRGLSLQIISGDHNAVVQSIGSQLGIPSAVAELSPETKAKIVEQEPYCLMIGDGANDAIALKQAFLGIAVHGSMEISLDAADVYVSTPGLTPVIDLFTIAEESQKIIHRNFSFSLFYNCVAAGLAISGLMNPLWAALIMPISASTIFVSSLWGTSKLRKLKNPSNPHELYSRSQETAACMS